MPTRQQSHDSAAATKRAWHLLVEVLGATATAALVRRSARVARVARPLAAYAELGITDAGLGYTCIVPAAWHVATPTADAEFRFWLNHALCPLLRELAGPVLIGVLARDPLLASYLTESAPESPDE